jgi:hypothetical protein
LSRADIKPTASPNAPAPSPPVTLSEDLSTLLSRLSKTAPRTDTALRNVDLLAKPQFVPTLRPSEPRGLWGRVMVRWTVPLDGDHLGSITMNGDSGEAVFAGPSGRIYGKERLALRDLGGEMRLEGSSLLNSGNTHSFVLTADLGRGLRVTAVCNETGRRCATATSIGYLNFARR